MAILSVDDYVAAAKQRLVLDKMTSRTATGTGTYFSLFDIAGNPGAGVLAGTSTSAGVVPTDATAGYPLINAFGGGASGYLTKVEYSWGVAGRIHLYDRIFQAGAYAFNANTALSSQPSFTGRCPGGVVAGLQIWVETVTAATGQLAVDVAYLNESGSGSSTGAVGIGGNPTLGRCWQLPLAAGDKGVSAITNVTGSVASVGTFNVMVLRPLWSCRVKLAADGGLDDLFRTGMPEIYDTSALYALYAPDGATTSQPALQIEIANA